MPLHGFRWLPTRQPVVTDLWENGGGLPVGGLFSTIANWSTSGLKDIEWRGEKYLWSKSPEFVRFAAAPKLAGEEFEIAVTIAETETRNLFKASGWRFASPVEMSIDYDSYKDYIRNSKGEFTVAKDQYVRLKTGWFSDRSACYLAAGRPVITQETGFSRYYGGGAGLFAFETLEEVAEAVRRINADYAAHSRAALDIGKEYFEAEKVLASLLERAGV